MNKNSIIATTLTINLPEELRNKDYWCDGDEDFIYVYHGKDRICVFSQHADFAKVVERCKLYEKEEINGKEK